MPLTLYTNATSLNTNATSLGSGIDSKRIQVIDVLRGFALLGIILTHSWQFFLYCSKVANITPEISVYDNAVGYFIEHLFMGKVFSIFSFLFGLSFAVQIKSAKSKGKPFIGTFAWRLIILLLIGYFHSQFYSGDILQMYALLGGVLILCKDLKNFELLVLAIVLYLLNISMHFLNLGIADDLQSLAVNAKKSEILKILGLSKFDVHIKSGRIFIVPSLFLLGLLAGRVNIFHESKENHILFKKILLLSLTGVIVCVVAFFFCKYSESGLDYAIDLNNTFRLLFQSFLYVAVIVLLFKAELFKKVLLVLAPVGQMGLTIYIMQSLLLGQLFINQEWIVGIGLASTIGITLLLFMVQVLFAKIWMSYFKYGPLEWIWRSLTYLKLQPILKKKA